jgi:uncharacterized protein YndB with AHSA1/START domain
VGETALLGLDLAAKPGVQEIVVIRVFDASRERVFRAHTDPKLFESPWVSWRLVGLVFHAAGIVALSAW